MKENPEMRAARKIARQRRDEREASHMIDVVDAIVRDLGGGRDEDRIDDLAAEYADEWRCNIADGVRRRLTAESAMKDFGDDWIVTETGGGCRAWCLNGERYHVLVTDNADIPGPDATSCAIGLHDGDTLDDLIVAEYVWDRANVDKIARRMLVAAERGLPLPGTRVRAMHDIDRFPFFTVPKGTEGLIVRGSFARPTSTRDVLIDREVVKGAADEYDSCITYGVNESPVGVWLDWEVVDGDGDA